jgi:N-acetyl-anhydromuramyl-L-alanine amidase AmpD
VSINNSNVTQYFPGLVYERPNANSNINITNISVPTIVDETTKNRFKIGKFGGPPTAFIVHHTAGALGRSPVSTFYSRGFPTQYWIDADGTIYHFIPDGLKGQHMKNGDTEKGRGLNNSNTIGVEIAAPGCSEVTKAQKNAAIYLAYMLGFNRDQVFGHGEVNSHKQDCEGVAVSELIRKGQIAT